MPNELWISESRCDLLPNMAERQVVLAPVPRILVRQNGTSQLKERCGDARRPYRTDDTAKRGGDRPDKRGAGEVDVRRIESGEVKGVLHCGGDVEPGAPQEGTVCIDERKVSAIG